MKTIEELKAAAKARAQELKLPYAGALLPVEAQQWLQSDPKAKLVDVRTQAEWEWVGHVPDAIGIEWNTWPEGMRNTNFIAQLQAEVPDASTPVMFLCRSGGRSHGAATAAAQAGYSNAYNVLEGFEGDKDANGQRNKVGGWRFAGLPWTQG